MNATHIRRRLERARQHPFAGNWRQKVAALRKRAGQLLNASDRVRATGNDALADALSEDGYLMFAKAARIEDARDVRGLGKYGWTGA